MLLYVCHADTMSVQELVCAVVSLPESSLQGMPMAYAGHRSQLLPSAPMQIAFQPQQSVLNPLRPQTSLL